MDRHRSIGRKTLIPTAVFACSLRAVVAIAAIQAKPLPDLFPANQINLEEFEPAVRDQVSKAYEEARKMPGDAAAVGKLGMLFQVYGRYELAESCYLRANGLDPRSFRWIYYLANAEKALGKNEQSIGHIREALAIDGGYTPARIRLAQLLLDAGDGGQSSEIYRSVIAQNKNLATAHFGLGQVLSARADWPAAIESYRRACEIAPNFAAAHYALGMAYRNAGDLAKARDHLEKYQILKETKQPSEDALMNDVTSLYSGGLTRFAKGSSLYQQGKAREAIQEFEAALEVNPKLVMAHINLIALYGQLGESDRSEQHFRAAVELDPAWVETYYNWGMSLVQQGKKTEAGEQFRKSVEINPNYVEALVQLGLLLDESGSFDEAAIYYKRALEVKPDYRQAHYFLGRNLLAKGRVHEAIPHLVETTNVEDAWTPVCMQTLAIAYERAGNRERAIYFFREGKRRADSRGMKDLASLLRGEIERLTSEAPRP